jgi:hypothetical protein
MSEHWSLRLEVQLARSTSSVFVQLVKEALEGRRD